MTRQIWNLQIAYRDRLLASDQTTEFWRRANGSRRTELNERPPRGMPTIKKAPGRLCRCRLQPIYAIGFMLYESFVVIDVIECCNWGKRVCI